MQSIQRQIGRYGKRSVDNSQISILLKDFEDANQLLSKIVEESKRWREAWTAILTHQHRLFSEFELLYQPIIGAGEEYDRHVPVETPEQTIERTSRIKNECDELKRDLKDVLDLVDTMIIRPAEDVKASLAIMKKAIKKREDKKLDYDRYQGRVESSMKKKNRSDRDNAALAKSEKDLSAATDSYHAADERLRNALPPLLQAVWSLQPHLLASQLQIQNSLLAHYYTVLHTYCTDEGFPNPPPGMDEVIRLWDHALRPTQKEAEAIPIIASGKTVRINGNAPASMNGYRRPSHQSAGSRGPSISPARAMAPAFSAPAEAQRPRITSNNSTSSFLSVSPSEPPAQTFSSTSSHSNYLTPTVSASSVGAYAPAGPNMDYFARERQPSTTAGTGALSPTQLTTAISSLAVGKKKPPPPPPRNPSTQFHFVTALYDFGGQSDGDLAFREGDRIKVLKKTDSVDDWWQGELRGVKGMFPANYCQ